MTPPTEGDRVGVTIDAEGVVSHVNSDGSLDVRFDGEDRELVEFIPARYVTRLRPLGVGDVVETYAELNALPEFSAVALNATRAIVAQKLDGRWFANGTVVDPLTWGGELYVVLVGRPEVEL